MTETQTRVPGTDTQRDRQSLPVWKLMLRRLVRKGSAQLGGCIVLALLVMAVFAPQIATHDPFGMNMEMRTQPPSGEHLLGTDSMGRDMFSRIVYGSRITLQIGLISVGISTIVGTIVGLMAGYLGGTFDMLVMRMIDILMSFAGILLALIVVAVLGPSLENAMIAVGISGIPDFARLVRGSTVSVKEEMYIEAARAQGGGMLHIMSRHVLPNIMSPIVILATLRFPAAIITAASLSFVGLGAQPPSPEWGALLVNARVHLRRAPWIVNYPGIAIMFSVLGFNLLGNALRDVMDPREIH